MARLLVNYSASYHDNVDVIETYEELRDLMNSSKSSHIELTMYGGRKTVFNKDRIITINESPLHEKTAAEKDAEDNVLVKNVGTGQLLKPLQEAETTVI